MIGGGPIKVTIRDDREATLSRTLPETTEGVTQSRFTRVDTEKVTQSNHYQREMTGRM